MRINSLNNFRKVRDRLISLRKRWVRDRLGVVLDETAMISLSASFEPGARGDIVIGAETLIAFKTLLFTRDPVTGESRPIRIGRRCFVGGGSMILPGVSIGDESIIGAGSVVFESVPPRCIVGGNPARVLRRDIEVGPFGRLKGADENTRRLWRADR